MALENIQGLGNADATTHEPEIVQRLEIKFKTRSRRRVLIQVKIHELGFVVSRKMKAELMLDLRYKSCLSWFTNGTITEMNY